MVEPVKFMWDDARHRVLYRLIGNFIQGWAEVEWRLMMVLAGLLGIDMNRARMILAIPANFRAKRELILRLGRSYLFDEDLAFFESVMQRVKHLSEKRNLVAHRRSYHLGRGTFRFFNDEDATQPNTFGRYADIQTATIRTWSKELEVLVGELFALTTLTVFEGRMLAQPRLIPEPSEDHSPSNDPRPNGAEEHPPQPPPSPK